MFFLCACSLNARMVWVLAKLEEVLPIYWNTSTRHFLLHMYTIILSLGNFWSISMLGVERLHVLIKTLSRGKKHLLATFQNKYSLFCQSQLRWKYATDHQWTNPRSIFGKDSVQPAEGYVVLMGKQIKRGVSDEAFKNLQNEWAIRDKEYDKFKDSYETYETRCKEQKKVPDSFANWNPLRSPTTESDRKKREKQCKWQSMTNTVWEVQRLTMDGVLFRTELIQNSKGVKTDNSYVIGETYTSDRQPDQRNTRSRLPEKCYGRLQRLYLHFMYPPSDEDLAAATEHGKLDPHKITNVPWAVFALCRWYEVMGVNPRNQLQQVRYNKQWTSGLCPLICMYSCFSTNCMLWPSTPFDNNKYDDEGKLIPGEVDELDYSEELHDVITHHD